MTLGLCAGCKDPQPSASDASVPDAGLICEVGSVEPAELLVGATSYPTVALAQDVLRSDISTQGLDYPDLYGPRLDATLQRHRVGEILMPVGFLLRNVASEASGVYDTQIATRFGPYMTVIDDVIAAGGRVRLQINCSTPEWLATYPHPHSVLSGADEASDEPVWACSAPVDLVAWRAIMQGVGEHFGSRANQVSFSIGSEPENYFAGGLNELLDWYTATVQGIGDSTAGASYKVGGLTVVNHQHASLSRTAPTLQGGTVTFTEEAYGQSITQSFIEHSAAQGLPLDWVTLHHFGGSPVPAEGTYWRRTRLDISAWLQASGYQPDQVEVVIEDWPQWAPYTSNDTEYFAAHMASGIISMLELSLIEGTAVRPVQAFLFEFGFRPDGEHPAGFSGRVGLSTEKGIIKPVFNLNSLLAELEGTLAPVQSSDPFVHAIAATGPDHATVLVVNQIPLEYQIEVLYDYWEQRPIMENYFSGDDLTGVAYNLLELIDVFFGGVMPPWPELIDAYLTDPSDIDLDPLSWPPEIKAAWTEMRRIGRLARPKRACNTEGRIALEALAAGSYRVEHYVIDSQLANAYPDREALEQRLTAAGAMGSPEYIAEVLVINEEYDAESGKLPDSEILLDDSREPFVIDMEPNSVHVVRFTAVP